MAGLADEGRKLRLQQLRRLNAAAGYLRDPARLAERINLQLAQEGHVEALLAKRFDTDGQVSGTPWKPLASMTARQRVRLGYGGTRPILRRSWSLYLAAVNGPKRVTPYAIFKEFKDGPAPVYLGRALHKRSRVARQTANANKFFGTRIGYSGSLSDYAEALNRVRPFYGPPTRQELGPIFTRRHELVQLVVWNISNGNSLRGIV